MREETPLVGHEATGSYPLSRYEDVARAFKDGVFTTDNYSWQVEPVHGRTILRLSGREHAVRRALVAPAFRGRELRERVLPVIVIMRQAAEDVAVSGGVIRKGATVTCLIGVANRDGRRYADQADVEVGVDRLLDAMPGLRLAEGAQPVERGVFTRGPASVRVVFDTTA